MPMTTTLWIITIAIVSALTIDSQISKCGLVPKMASLALDSQLVFPTRVGRKKEYFKQIYDGIIYLDLLDAKCFYFLRGYLKSNLSIKQK